MSTRPVKHSSIGIPRLMRAFVAPALRTLGAAPPSAAGPDVLCVGYVNMTFSADSEYSREHISRQATVDLVFDSAGTVPRVATASPDAGSTGTSTRKMRAAACPISK